MNTIDIKPTHLATLKGRTLQFHHSEFETTLAAFVRECGGGVPQIDLLPIIDLTTTLVATPTGIRRPVAVRSATSVAKIGVGQMDVEGRERSAKDRDAAVLAGFAPRQPVYERGLRATGMAEHKAKFEQLPETRDAMNDLVRVVEAEERSDLGDVLQSSVRMRASGVLTIGTDGTGTDLLVTDRALPSLCSRLGMPPGAGTYLRGIRPEVRAINVNRWCAEDVPARDAAEFEAADAENALRIAAGTPKKELPGPSDVVLRTRKSGAKREVFGVVSDGYAPFDADLVARAINRAIDAEGPRSQVAYDGYRTKVDVMWFSDVEPSHAVAGEYFKAGIRVRTDDTGGGSCRVSAIVRQALCHNFIIIDQAQQDIAVIRHVGDVATLAKRFEVAIQAAHGKLGHFIEAWGGACEEDVLARSLELAKAGGVIDSLAPYVGMPVSLALPGIFNAMVEREVVPLPKRNSPQVVGDLMAMWSKDVSGATLDKEGKLTRGAVINAFTRYAHEVNVDPFKAHEIESAAGSLLYGSKGGSPAPLPFLPME